MMEERKPGDFKIGGPISWMSVNKEHKL
jgi:hypothetical protein